MPVLIAYDGSTSAKHAISVAHSVLERKAAILLHVWTPPLAVVADAFGAPSSPQGPSLVELERWALERAQQIAAQGHDLARHQGFAVEARVERADAPVWRAILDVADEIDAELIVVGTHGATAVESALLGSVSNAVVHHSKRPVLVAPAASG